MAMKTWPMLSGITAQRPRLSPCVLCHQACLTRFADHRRSLRVVFRRRRRWIRGLRRNASARLALCYAARLVGGRDPSARSSTSQAAGVRPPMLALPARVTASDRLCETIRWSSALVLHRSVPARLSNYLTASAGRAVQGDRRTRRTQRLSAPGFVLLRACTTGLTDADVCPA